MSDYANAILEDSQGDFWIGTDKGLNRYRRRSGQWENFLQNPDSTANVILNVCEDSDGRIWVGSYGNGVSIIDPAQGTARTLPVRRHGGNAGVATECVFAIARDANGEMWMGGINGDITRYDPATDSYRYYGEDCVSAIVPDADGRLLFAGNMGIGRCNPATDAFEWTRRYDSIEVRYPARCVLDDPRNGRLYTFRVRAVDLYTGEELGTRRLDISVRPPLWLTWWAKIIYLLLSAALVAFLASYIRHYRREKKIEGQIESFAAVAHDIRTPISLIKSPLLNIEMEKDLPESVRSNLLQARSGIDKAMDMLGEMLELRTETRLGPHLRVRPLDPGEFLRVKTEEYAMLAKFKGLAL